MLTWQGSGGLSVDASVRIDGEDHAGIERLVEIPPVSGSLGSRLGSQTAWDATFSSERSRRLSSASFALTSINDMYIVIMTIKLSILNPC